MTAIPVSEYLLRMRLCASDRFEDFDVWFAAIKPLNEGLRDDHGFAVFSERSTEYADAWGAPGESDFRFDIHFDFHSFGSEDVEFTLKRAGRRRLDGGTYWSANIDEFRRALVRILEWWERVRDSAAVERPTESPTKQSRDSEAAEPSLDLSPDSVPVGPCMDRSRDSEAVKPPSESPFDGVKDSREAELSLDWLQEDRTCRAIVELLRAEGDPMTVSRMMKVISKYDKLAHRGKVNVTAAFKSLEAAGVVEKVGKRKGHRLTAAAKKAFDSR